jgi:protocatechuate 3,4-dioxygenase beta subunit
MMELKLSKNQLLGFIIFIVVIIVLLLGLVLLTLPEKINLSVVDTSESCVPAFADGGGPYYLANQPFRENIAEGSKTGQKLIIEGRILNNNCTKKVPNIVVDIWQASNEGEYEDEYYRGQIISNDNGEYRFETIMPKGYGEGTGYRPPHIHFKLFENNTEIITSQMFFDDTRGLEGFNDAYIIDVEEREGVLYGNYDIVMP